jgi:hypothetical protein
MAQLPTSLAGATISSRLTAPNPNAYDTTPALQALNRAFEQGLVNSEYILQGIENSRKRRLNRQLMDEEQDLSRRRMELAPDQFELEKAKLDANLQILPKQRAHSEALLDTDIELLPLQRDAKKRELVAAGEDPDGSKTALIGAYVKNFGKLPPKLADGSYDFEAIGAELGPLFEEAREAEIEKMRGSGSGKEELTGQQRLDAEKAQVAAQAIIEDLQGVQSELFATDTSGNVVRDPSGRALTTGPNAVGPLMGRAPGKVLAAIQALLGSPDRLAKQRAVTMLANSLTLEKTAALKGQISNYEIQFLKESLPNTDDDEVVWDRYLKKAIPTLEKVLAATQKVLDGETPAGEAPPASSNEGRVLVKTKAEFDALKPGTKFVDAFGVPGTK